MTDHIPLGTGDGTGGAGPAGGDLSGTYPNPSVVGVSIDSTPTAHEGVTTTVAAGETLAFGDPVFIKSDGKVWKADANVAGAFPAVGLCVVGGAANATVTILLHGTAHDASWNWTVGTIVWLSDTAGLTQTVPSADGVNPINAQQVAVALTADDIYWQPALGGVLPTGWNMSPSGLVLTTPTGIIGFSVLMNDFNPTQSDFDLGKPADTEVNFSLGGNAYMTWDETVGLQLLSQDQNEGVHLTDYQSNPVVSVGMGSGQALGFFGTPPINQPTVSVADSASIITALADLGLIVDGT